MEKHGRAMGLPVFVMGEVENRNLPSFTRTTPSHFFWYVHDTWLTQIETKEMETFSIYL